MRIIVVLLYLLMILIFVVPFSMASYVWNNSLLDGRGSCGKYISASVLSDGSYCVSFFSNGRLRYAQSYLDSGEVKWQLMDVDKSAVVGMFTSLAVRSSDRPSIAYYDLDNGNLKIARRSGGTWDSAWTVSKVDSTDDSGTQASMAIASDGGESIAYLTISPDGQNVDLIYTHAVGASWFKQTLPVSAIDRDSRLSLAFAPDGLPAITYHQQSPSQPVYVKLEPSMSWTSQVVDSSISGGKDASLVFLPDGNPGISYHVEYNPATRTYNDLRYAHFDGTQWIREDVDFGSDIYSNLGYFSSLKLDSTGKPTIAYYEHDKTSVRYAYQVNDEWRCDVVQLSGLVGPYTTLIYGTDELPVIFYYDMGWTQLTWAHSVQDHIPEMDIKGNGVIILDGDTTPSLGDHTDFGSAEVITGTVTRVFTIENTGSNALYLTGSPRVQISGTEALDFTVKVQPASPIIIGSSATFEITFVPIDKGLRSATISISNNDPNENPYNFSICGTGRLNEPEMNVKGNNLSIPDGDTTPSLSDHTDFGSIDVSSGEIIRTFTIENTGSGQLNLNGDPKVQVSGVNAADFTVITQPTSPVLIGGTAVFQVKFDPSAKGIRNAVLIIPNDDANENPYDFCICGKGLPALEVAIRQINIANDGTHDILIRFDGVPDYRFDMYYSDSPQNANPEWIFSESGIDPNVEWRDNGDSRTGNIHPSQVPMRRYRIIGYTMINALHLVPADACTYIKPNESVIVEMLIYKLQQLVKSCQAFVGYDSTYFTVTSVTAGGGVWDDLIWGVYNVAGQVDTAIGVYGESSPSQGTNEDGIVARFTLVPKGIEAITRVWFRPNLNPDPGLVGSTYLSNMSAFPVWPEKIDSTRIYIDGTAPTVNILSAKQDGSELLISLGSTTNAVVGIVNIQVTAADVVSAGACSLDGVPAVTVTPFGGITDSAAYVNESPLGTFNYIWQITDETPNGAAIVNSSVADKAGNTASDSNSFNINKL